MNSPASDRLKELYASWAKAQERKTGAMLAYQLRPCDTSPEGRGAHVVRIRSRRRGVLAHSPAD